MSFGDDIGKFALKFERRSNDVRRAATQDMAREMVRTNRQGGRLPILTGNLRRSFVAALNMAPIAGAGGQQYAESTVGLVIASAKPADDIYLAFQANYARPVNYGRTIQLKAGGEKFIPGAHFVEGAYAMWDGLVDKHARALGVA